MSDIHRYRTDSVAARAAASAVSELCPPGGSDLLRQRPRQRGADEDGVVRSEFQH